MLGRARPQAVMHTAAIPDPVHDPAHVVFATNQVEFVVHVVTKAR